jgi:amino acid adenylation domain-containing protein
MFDFDLPLYDSVDYYKKIWFGIDLSRHFCEFYFWTIPSPEFIAHISRTFKYAYLNIDLCSFSQEHRRQLAALGLVKPQPTDNQVFSFCDLCREYQNIEFGITLIAGLPYFTYKDIDAGNDFLARLTERYANFRSVQWGRLHAQPGAPILDESKNKNFGIQHHSLAKEFDDFLHYSELNYKCQKYPDLEEMHYPLVYLNDDALNSKISHHYSDINKRIHRHLNTRQSQTTALLEVTYRELNQKVGEAAAGLRGQGMQPDDIIALKVKPSLEMIVGILGILEAGGAYLPIDPDYPEERIDYMLKDSGAKILLTGQDIADFHPSQALSSKNRVNHHSKNLAYIIYTSGTTGRPKGAAVEHRQAVNTLLSRKIEYKMQPGDSALQLFSYAFDGFVTAFFTPIISGSTVVFLEGDGAKNPMKMKEAVAKFKITHFISVPALFRSIIEYLTPEEASSLKVITLAGDRLSPGVPEMAGQKNKHLEIAHEYGVTEAAVMSTLFRHQEKNRQITVGRPVGNTKLYIICPRQGQWLQPIGIPGELCIAGAGVSRGYLNNPQLTAEKFIKNSYSKKQRLYKTGDLARWLPDGSVEFLGRIDRQVKIRGFRIEPGEIETLLMKHPRVKEAVLTAPRDETGEKFLCAYVVPNPKAGTELIENLGNHLSKSLPAYMVPPYIKTVEKIPLTPNGKIDRNALPEPVITGSNEKYTAPRNELEEKLVHLWARVLKIEKHIVGIDTNFFDIGGHSLNATILITEIHKALDVNVPMMEIFKQPTIKGLSDYILAAGKDKYTAIPLVEKKEYYPLSSAQKRLYIIQQLNLQSTVYNIPQMVELDGEPDPHLLEKVFKKLIHRHESLRTAFELVDGEPVQRIYESHEVEFKIERSTAGTETGFVRPFELSRAPLMRVELITKAKNNYLLMIDMHHITADGFSHEIMVREFVSLYAADPLPELMLQYKDYCQWQQSDQVKKTIRQQEAYWLNVFPGNIPELSLPTDYPRPLIQNFTGDSLEFTLGKTAANDLNKMASQENVSLYMILLALTNVWLSRLCNQEDIIIGIYTTGRTHADLEQIIGMFLKTLALRTYPKTNSSFNEFLAEVKESTLEAFENQDYPFESLVKKVMAQRKSNRNPLFDAAIDLHNDADKKFSGSSTTGDKLLKVKPYPYEMRESKLDIGIIVLQTADNLFFTVEYSTQLFKKETIESFFEYFKDIVSQVITNRNIKLKEINPLNPFVSPEPVRPVMEFDF